MEPHGDGFSFTGVPLYNDDGDISKRRNCYEQMHVHYWANQGKSSAQLSSGKFGDLVSRALREAYQRDYAKACYEMKNRGSWDGFLRVRFNNNSAQTECYKCGGHSN